MTPFKIDINAFHSSDGKDSYKNVTPIVRDGADSCGR